MNLIERRRWYFMTVASGSGGLSPASILGSSLVAWFDANDADTTFQDSGATTPATANNDPIGAWQDKSGNGYHATQGTTANKPRIKTATLNGKTVVNFDGSDILVTGNVPISTFVIWIVLRVTVDNRPMIYEQSIDSNLNAGRRLFNDTGDLMQTNVNISGRSTKTNTVATGRNFVIWRQEYNGTHASHLLYKNGALQTLSDIIIGNPGSGTTTDALYIGARSGVAFPLTGDIAEIVIASPYVTAEQIADMDAYINNKWAVY